MKVVILIFMLFNQSIQAMEIKASQKNGKLIIKASAIPLPDEIFRKQIKTGLTTTVLTQLIVSVNKESRIQFPRTFLVYFDLWDEVYQLRTAEGEKVEKKSLKDADLLLQQIQNQVFEIDAAALPSQFFDVSIRLTLNPISKEKKQKIRKWLAENNVGLPAGANLNSSGMAVSTSADASKAPSPISGARFGGVMSKVLNSELDEETSGAWIFNSEPQRVSLSGVNHDQ
ncbi:MAG: hypothetical protein ACXWQE_04235 [Bdellovibrionales bacterium]